MDLRLVETFLSVAKTGNITQAAEKLNFSQPTVTAQIRTLEEHFGVLLFERVGKKLYITEAGRRFIRYAEQLLLIHGEAQAALQEYSYDKVIKIGLGTAVAAHMLSPVLREFQEHTPTVTVKIEHCFDLPITVKGILDNRFDVALVHDKICNNRIVQFDVAVQRLIWITHSSLIEKYGDNIGHHPFIALRPGSIYRAKYDEVLREKAINPVLEYSDSEAILQAVRNGLGSGILPEVLVRKDVDEQTLVACDYAPKLNITFSVIFHRDKTFTSALRMLLAKIADHANIDGGLSDYLRHTADDMRRDNE